MKLQTAAPSVASRVAVRRSAVCVKASKGEETDIYIGFPKNDYAPRAGRKGRVIKGDPKNSPGREDLGFFLGATGGWAGGEAGLWQLRDEIKESMKDGTESSTDMLAPPSPVRQPAKTKWGVKPQAGQDEIYVGFGKDQLDLKKSGMPGRVIYDEAYKYPGREDMGFFKGLVGGFAGGEAVLKEFAASGELKIRKPGEGGPVKKQFSPLTLAFLIIFVVGGGGVLITSLLDIGAQ